MSRILCSIGALLLAATPLHAAGIERTNQSIGIIFEPGRILETGLIWVKPKVEGDYTALPGIDGQPTGNVAGSHALPSLAYKQDFSTSLSGAVIVDQPLGADTRYPVRAGALLGGTGAQIDSTHVTGVMRWKGDSPFGVHGGIRLSSAKAEVDISGMAFTAAGLPDYHVTLDRTLGWGWLAGVSWEKPEIAARVSLTYNSQISHDFPLSESLNGGPGSDSNYKVTTPRSWNLEFQTGIAPRTLAFGSVRWVKWSEFRLNPPVFDHLDMPNTDAGIIELKDSTTWTLGLGRQFTDSWSGAASVSWEKADKILVSPLSSVDGRKSLTLAGIYTRDRMKVTMGASWIRLGDANVMPDLTGTANLGVPSARMTENDAFAFGIRTAFTF